MIFFFIAGLRKKIAKNRSESAWKVAEKNVRVTTCIVLCDTRSDTHQGFSVNGQK